MPQLNTAPWLMTILSMFITLFILFQIKVSNFTYPLNPSPVMPDMTSHLTPWETKWTKIYLPLSLLPQK